MSERVVAMIPARAGSTRLKLKNLALLRGKPLIAYAIDAALRSGVFSRVVVNGDHPAFEDVAERYGAAFYLRPPEHGTSDARSDAVVYDFLAHHPCDAVAWVNPIAPLQPADEIRSVVRAFFERGLDSMITVATHQVHAVLNERPVNFVADEPFALTQDLDPVHTFAYSVMMWRAAPFIAAYERDGYAVLNGRVGYLPVSRRSGIIVKTADDLRLADALLAAESGGDVEYDPLADRILGGSRAAHAE